MAATVSTLIPRVTPRDIDRLALMISTLRKHAPRIEDRNQITTAEIHLLDESYRAAVEDTFRQLKRCLLYPDRTDRTDQRIELKHRHGIEVSATHKTTSVQRRPSGGRKTEVVSRQSNTYYAVNVGPHLRLVYR